MISIKTTQGQELNLQVDLRLSIEETSVFDSKQGSYSLPLLLPYTDHNAKVLELPSNIARKQKFVTSVDVIISAGTWIRHASLQVDESVYNEHIQCTLFLRESPFFAKIEDLQLTDVFKEKIVDLYPDLTGVSKMSQLLQHMQEVAVGEIVTDYFVFPVCADIEDKEITETTSDATVTKRWQRFKILNQQITPDANNEFGAIGTSQGKTFYVLVGTQYEYTDGGVSYALPTGYGVTPFLKFTYILREIFNHLGYTLATSIFDTDASFKKMCLLNNTIDAIVTGVIDYSQLVPDVSVSEFFEFVENSFGCELVIDEMHKTATPRFWNDVLSEAPTGSLSKKFEDYPKITYKNPESVKLTIGRDNKETLPITYESFNELFAKYGTPIYKANYKATVNDLVARNVRSGDFFYYFADKFVYMLFTGGYVGPRYVIEKDTLDYFVKDDKVVLREINTEFEALAMKDIATGGVTGVKTDFEITIWWLPKTYADAYAAQLSSAYTTEDRLIAKMPYIDSYRHLNSVVQKKAKKGTKETVSEEKEKEVSLPIIPCFQYGLAKPDPDMQYLERTFFATTHRYDNMGNTWGTFDLTTKSLYERFWKKFDQVIQSSYHDVSGSAQLSMTDVMNLKFDKQYLLDNQTVLPTSIQYELSDDGVEVTNLSVKTTKVYE